MRQATNEDARQRVKLYGMPIAHSLSPFSSKAVFEGLGLKNFRYELCECASLDDPASTFKEDITNPKSLGCAVTIPHKMSVIPYLDGLSDTAKAVGSVNLTYYECDAKSGEERHIGTNTDVEGVRVVLISALTGAITPFPKDLPQTFEKGTAAGLCIGAGGAARAVVWALHLLGLSPIFVLNRDDIETAALQKQFAQLDLRHLKSRDEARDALLYLEKERIELCVAVGAIPSHEPITSAEKEVYALSQYLLSKTSLARSNSRLQGTAENGVNGGHHTNGSSLEKHIPFPEKCVFLDMAYKPLMTRLRQLSEEAGWTSLSGLDVLVELKFIGAKIWTGHTVDAALREKVRKLVRQKVEGTA